MPVPTERWRKRFRSWGVLLTLGAIVGAVFGWPQFWYWVNNPQPEVLSLDDYLARGSRQEWLVLTNVHEGARVTVTTTVTRDRGHPVSWDETYVALTTGRANDSPARVFVKPSRTITTDQVYVVRDDESTDDAMRRARKHVALGTVSGLVLRGTDVDRELLKVLGSEGAADAVVLVQGRRPPEMTAALAALIVPLAVATLGVFVAVMRTFRGLVYGAGVAACLLVVAPLAAYQYRQANRTDTNTARVAPERARPQPGTAAPRSRTGGTAADAGARKDAPSTPPLPVDLLPSMPSLRVVLPAGQPELERTRGFDVSPRENIVLQTSDNLYDVGAGRYLLSTPARGLSHAAFMGDGSLLVVHDDRLAYYEAGALIDAAKLPAAGFRLVAESLDTAYLYGGTGAAAGIYRLAKPGRLTKLFDAANVSALAAVHGRIFFAIDGGLYTAKSGEPVAALFRDPALRIESIAVDPKSGSVLFATDDAVYAIKDGKVMLLLDGLGGVLKIDRASLYVFSSRHASLAVAEDVFTQLAARPSE